MIARTISLTITLLPVAGIIICTAINIPAKMHPAITVTALTYGIAQVLYFNEFRPII